MVLFDELLQAADLVSAVDELAKDFRKKFALPAVHQLGLVVPDVERAAGELERKGMGPFFIAAGSADFWIERGDKVRFRGKMGIGYYKGLEVELLEPGNGSDFYAGCIDGKGRPVLQHLGFGVPDVDVWASILTQAGFPVYVRGQLSAWPTRTQFAYMDTVKETGLVIEFIAWSLLGFPFRPPAGAFHAIGGLQKISGMRSLSFK